MTVSDIVERIQRDLAGTTVINTVRILDDKGFLRQTGKRGRAFLYEAAVDRESAGESMTPGRKTRLSVDTLDLVLSVVVHSASPQDHDGACFVLSRIKEHFERLKAVLPDSAYQRNGLPEWTKETFGWALQPELRPVA